MLDVASIEDVIKKDKRAAKVLLSRGLGLEPELSVIDSAIRQDMDHNELLRVVGKLLEKKEDDDL